MTDFYLIVVFLFCAAAGYIAVSRGGGFLEKVLFQNSEVWYTVREDSRACENAEAGNAFLWNGIFERQMSAMEASPDRTLGKRRSGGKTEGYKVRSGA